MFKKYKISLNEILTFIGEENFIHITRNIEYRNWINRQYAAYEGKCLQPMIFGESGVIKADILSANQFPINRNMQVFISHSSKDAVVAKVFAYILSAWGINCFIDSMIWNNISDLQRDLDEKYCWLKRNELFDYEKRNNSTAHVHTMLSSALFEMIDICECCVFIESNNSEIKLNDIRDTSTFSPWIFSEINYINKIRLNIPLRYQNRTQLFSEGGILNESTNLQIAYPLKSIDDMKTITFDHLYNLNLYASQHTGEEVLDRLYRINPC